MKAICRSSAANARWLLARLEYHDDRPAACGDFAALPLLPPG